MDPAGDEYVISKDRGLMQADRMYAMLSKTYWAKKRLGMPSGGSLC